MVEAEKFVKVPYWVLDNKNIAAIQKLIIIVLMRHANNQNECYPSISTISKLTGLSEKTVQRHLKEIVEKKLVKREYGKKGRYVGWFYKINYGQNDTSQNDHGGQSDPGQRVHGGQLGSVLRSESPVYYGQRVRRTISNEHISNEHISNEHISNELKGNAESTPPTYQDKPKDYIKYWKKQITKRGRSNYPGEFETWCEAYPRVEDKKGAFSRYLDILAAGDSPEDLLKAAKNYRKAKEGKEKQYIKRATTFLGTSKSEPWRGFLQEQQNTDKSKPAYYDRTIENCPKCGALMHPDGFCNKCGYEKARVSNG